MSLRIDDASLGHVFLERNAERAFPYLVHERYVAQAHGFIDRRTRVRRDVLNIGAGHHQDFANNLCADDLAGPVVDRDDDRIG